MVRIVAMITMIISVMRHYNAGTNEQNRQKCQGEYAFFHNGLFVLFILKTIHKLSIKTQVKILEQEFPC